MGRKHRTRTPSLGLITVASLTLALLLSITVAAGTWALPGQNAFRSTVPVNTPLPTVTATATPTVTIPTDGTLITTVFRQWSSPADSYAGVQDTYLDLYHPAANFGGAGTTKVHSGADARERTLIRFDLTAIPANATVTRATLNLFCWYRSIQSSVTAHAYPVLVPWSESEATWNERSAGVPWNSAGCGDPLSDYDASQGVSTTLGFTSRFYEWDITGMVQQWVANPGSNMGLLLVCSGTSAEYQFRTSEIVSADQRPYLELAYYLSTPTATATATLTATPSPTCTNTPTSTTTPGMTPTPSTTPTSTPVVSPTPTRIPSGTTIHIEYQQGRWPDSDYQGARDAILNSYDPEVAPSTLDSLRVNSRGFGSERSLLYFDLGEYIPPGTTVVDARVSLFASSRRTLFGVRVSAFEVLRPWDAAAANWRSANASEQWSVGGCDGSGSDRSAKAASSHFVYLTNRFYDWDVTELVQRWVDDPARNHGLLFLSQDVDQQIAFRSCEWRAVEQRPRLSVTYLMP